MESVCTSSRSWTSGYVEAFPASQRLGEVLGTIDQTVRLLRVCTVTDVFHFLDLPWAQTRFGDACSLGSRKPGFGGARGRDGVPNTLMCFTWVQASHYVYK